MRSFLVNLYSFEIFNLQLSSKRINSLLLISLSMQSELWTLELNMVFKLLSKK